MSPTLVLKTLMDGALTACSGSEFHRRMQYKTKVGVICSDALDLTVRGVQFYRLNQKEEKKKKSDKSRTDDCVRVVVRCRPLNEKEKGQGFKSIAHIDEVRGQVQVTNPNAPRGEPPKTFTFDTVFAPGCKQTDVYNQTARPIVDAVMEGYNGTIFAYGQTGTGKTFTMEGVRAQPELRGIIPNSFAHIFGQIAKSGGEVRFLVRVSYLEIYNEEVRDLLGKNQQQRLEVKERPDVGVYVKDLSAFVVNNADDMDRIMTLGNKNCSVGSTNMNEQSSRSHAIFTITVERSDTGIDKQQHVRAGKLHMVDLAGSERQTKTGATGKRLLEATKINLSLSTLGNIISSLVDGKSTHIPYRNSKLTRLLQDSLGGNAKTVMCANMGPAEYNYDETISTLRYANRAKSIKNKAKINEDPKDALLRQFQNEIEELKKQLGDEGGGEEEESGSEESEEEIDEVTGERRKKPKRKKGKKNLSPEKMAEMQRKIDEERRALESKKDMEEEEKNKVQSELVRRENDLKKAQQEHDDLAYKLSAIEKKVIVGGVDLLKKSEEQERLLEESAKEIEERMKKQETLRRELEEKEAERIDIEEKYANLQEEAVGKTKKLKKVWSMLMSAKSEVADLQQEHQREMEGTLENIRQLSQELRLQMLIIDSFIPQDFQAMIEQYVHWNEDIGEWQLKCVAYTGNNMRKQTPVPDKDKTKEYGESDLSNVYLAYTAEGVQQKYKPYKSGSSTRSKTAGGRQKGGKKCSHEGCDAGFLTPSKLKRHTRQHEGYTCTQEGCCATFDKWSLLRKHVADDHATEHKCHECKKIFYKKHKLTVHLKQHSDTKECFLCPRENCQYTTLRLHEMDLHINNYHEGARPFVCQHEGCTKTFVHKNSKMKHQIVHSPGYVKPQPKPKKKRGVSSILAGYPDEGTRGPRHSQRLSQKTNGLPSGEDATGGPSQLQKTSGEGIAQAAVECSSASRVCDTTNGNGIQRKGDGDSDQHMFESDMEASHTTVAADKPEELSKDNCCVEETTQHSDTDMDDSVVIADQTDSSDKQFSSTYKAIADAFREECQILSSITALTDETESSASESSYLPEGVQETKDNAVVSSTSLASDTETGADDLDTLIKAVTKNKNKTSKTTTLKTTVKDHAMVS